jgi:hypothetical protein
MRWFVSGLYVLAGLLLIGAIVLAGRRVAREHHKLAAALDEVDRLNGDETLSDEEREQRKKSILVPQFTWGRVTYTYEWIQRLILRDALDG